MLLLQRDELVEAAFLNIELLVEDEHSPGNVAHTDEGIDDVRAQIRGDIIDTVTAYVRTIDSPVAKVTDCSRSLCNADISRLQVSYSYILDLHLCRIA